MKSSPEKPKETPEIPFPSAGSITTHALKVGSSRLNYTATADWVTLRKINKPVAHIFHTAYLATATKSRPITFVFNGGPGAASAYLHMGALGPRRVAFGPSGTLPKPPTQVVDNTESWLAFTDLVFIDPVGTGFSRAIEDPPAETKGGETKPSAPKENPEFWEVEKDLESLGEFISRFLSKHHRWTSPVYIAGESYGGFRVAKMARMLQENHGVGLSGALLISPAIEFDSLLGSDYNLTQWVELLPSLAASAFQHGVARNLGKGATMTGVLKKAEAFATGDFTLWLAQGDAMSTADQHRILTTMADMCGLSKEVVERAGGRIAPTLFCRELLRNERKLCGHYDASITTVDPYPDRPNYEGPDPTLFSIDRLFTGAINHQLRTTLKLSTELDYRLLSMEVNETWKDKTNKGTFHKLTGAMDDLRYGMSLNAHMKVMIVHGLFDLVTPYFSSQRLTHLMKLTKAQKQNLITRNYPGGHMFYSWDTSRKAFRKDVEAFYK